MSTTDHVDLVFFFFSIHDTYTGQSRARSFASVPFPRHIRDGDREEKRERGEGGALGAWTVQKSAVIWRGEALKTRSTPPFTCVGPWHDVKRKPCRRGWKAGAGKSVEGRFRSVFTACRHTWSYTSRLVAGRVSLRGSAITERMQRLERKSDWPRPVEGDVAARDDLRAT